MSKNSPIVEFFDRSFSDESYPRIKYCPDQTSLCMFGPIDSGGMIHWRPVKRAASTAQNVIDEFPASDYTPLAKEFASGYWSSSLECWFGYEPLILNCGAWNEATYRERQIQLHVHFCEQEDLGYPASLPLGVSSSGSDCCYAMRVDNGQVWLEEPDGRPFEKQASSMASFFAALRYQPVTEDLLNRVFD